jgi:hypothetical protein
MRFTALAAMASIAPLALCAGSPAIGATHTLEASASGGSPINYQGDNAACVIRSGRGRRDCRRRLFGDGVEYR